MVRSGDKRQQDARGPGRELYDNTQGCFFSISPVVIPSYKHPDKLVQSGHLCWQPAVHPYTSTLLMISWWQSTALHICPWQMPMALWLDCFWLQIVPTIQQCNKCACPYIGVCEYLNVYEYRSNNERLNHTNACLLQPSRAQIATPTSKVALKACQYIY